MAQVLACLEMAEPECIFCGDKNVKRWDHLVPVKKGGETVLGNMVPACGPCDDSKQDEEFRAWMRGDAPKSPTSRKIPDVEDRIRRIEKYVASCDYQPQALKDRLSPGELERYQKIMDELEDLRSRADDLIKDYRARTGQR